MSYSPETNSSIIANIMERWQKMTITSDPMFGMVMENKKICLELIRRALPRLKVNEIVHLTTQKDINVFASRKVRYDVYVRDDHGRIIVIEMQVANKGNLPLRLRYYQEQIDHGLIRPGDNYRTLTRHPTYVIMFCDFDYFGRGWASYAFEHRCLRDLSLELGDRRKIIIFNAMAKKFTTEEKTIKSFLDLMRKRVDNNDRFITQIQNEITKVKQDPERRAGFMKFELDLMDAKREAHEKGLEEGLKEGQSVANNKAIKEFVINFKELGLDTQDIKQRLMRSFNLTAEQATQAVQNK